MDALPLTLVVDDDATTRFLTCRLLQRAQVAGRVVEASDGQQALTLLEELCATTASPPPVLVLVDLNMPVMDGVTFLQHQQALPLMCRQCMTTVVVSSSAAATDQQRVRGLAQAYVTKPLTSAVLQQLLLQHGTRCGAASHHQG